MPRERREQEGETPDVQDPRADLQKEDVALIDLTSQGKQEKSGQVSPPQEMDARPEANPARDNGTALSSELKDGAEEYVLRYTEEEKSWSAWVGDRQQIIRLADILKAAASNAPNASGTANGEAQIRDAPKAARMVSIQQGPGVVPAWGELPGFGRARRGVLTRERGPW